MKAWVINFRDTESIPAALCTDMPHSDSFVVGFAQVQGDCIWLSVKSYESEDHCRQLAQESLNLIWQMRGLGATEQEIEQALKSVGRENVAKN